MKTDLSLCQCLLLAEAQPEAEAQGRAGREEMGVKRWKKTSSKTYWSCLRYAWCSGSGPKV